MAFPAGRDQLPMPALEPCGGGLGMKCHIPTEARHIPGYTGFVPGRKIGTKVGLGKTFGAATGELLNGNAVEGGKDGWNRTLPNDFKEEPAQTLGMYTRPANTKEEAYTSASTGDYAKSGFERKAHTHVAGYAGHIPNIRDRISGPGEQYTRQDAPGAMSLPADTEGRLRTELRDSTRNYDEPYRYNELSEPVTTSKVFDHTNKDDHVVIHDLDRKFTDMEDTNQARALINATVSPVKLGIGPQTTDSPWNNRNPYNAEASVSGIFGQGGDAAVEGDRVSAEMSRLTQLVNK